MTAPIAAPASDAALEELDALFDDFYAWFGRRYDPATGGVFYSAAAQARPDTDASGRALKTRDNLHVLVHGHAAPLGSAADPRLFQAAVRTGE